MTQSSDINAQTDADTFVRTVLAPAIADASDGGFALVQTIVSAIFADVANFDAGAEPDYMVPRMLALAKAAANAKPVMEIFHFDRWKAASFLAGCPLCGEQIGRGTVIAGGACPACGEWMPGTGNALAGSKVKARPLPH